MTGAHHRQANGKGYVRAKALASGEQRFEARLRNQFLGTYHSRAAATAAIERAKCAEPEGVCRECGCTDEWGCDGGCSWANAKHTLCSACVGTQEAR